jgi:hypothetical protein
MTPTGLEHPTNSPGKTHVLQTGDVKSAALHASSDLQAIIDAWPRLPADARQKIMWMIGEPPAAKARDSL